MDKQTFLKVRISKNRKFLGSFRYRKSANFLCVPVCKWQIRKFLWFFRKSQIRKYLQNTAQLCFKKVIKSFTCKSVNRKKIGSAFANPQNCHIGGRSANLTNYSSQQICDLRNVIADRPPLRILHTGWSSATVHYLRKQFCRTKSLHVLKKKKNGETWTDLSFPPRPWASAPCVNQK